MRNGNWMETYTGKRFYPLDPRPDDVCLEDIAHALSLACRYNGHSKFFFSVAQHSLNCREMAERMGLIKQVQLLCLLHDAAEAYIGDMVRPMKPLFLQFEVMENKIQKVIYEALGVKEPDRQEREIVSRIDNIQLVTEAKVLMPFKEWGEWSQGLKHDKDTWICEKSASLVEGLFLLQARGLLKGAANEQLSNAQTEEHICCGDTCTCGDGCTCDGKCTCGDKAAEELRDLP